MIFIDEVDWDNDYAALSSFGFSRLSNICK